VKLVKAGILYFALVFAAGFLLGVIRTIVVAPGTGARAAELAEIPIMLLVSFFAARAVVRRLAVPPAAISRLAVGLLALGLLLSAEISLTLPVREMTPSEYASSRDPVAGFAYAASLAVFALLPLLVSRRR